MTHRHEVAYRRLKQKGRVIKVGRVGISNYLAREIDDKIEVTFLHSPAYYPDFNLAEYEIHLLRLQKLHHLPSTVTIE